MNGPFFSERGIESSYSSTRRSFTHCARRILRNPRTGPDTRCETGQKGHTNRVPCAFGIFSTITAHPALQKRNSTCGAGASFETRPAGFADAFTAGFAARRGTAFRARAARRVARRDVLVAAHKVLSIPRRAGFIFLPLRKLQQTQVMACAVSTIIRSLLTLLSRLRAQCRKSPRSLRVVALHAAFTAAVRVVHRVHRHAAHRRTLAVPPRASRLAVRHVLVVQIAELADRGHAIHAELPHFARRQLHQRDVAFFAQQAAPRRPPRAPLARPCRDTAPGCAPSCRAECAGTAARCPEECPRPRRSAPSCPLPGPPDAGCSASRRPRSAAARCAPTGSDRIRWPPPSPGCRSSRAGNRSCGTACACPPPRCHDVISPCELRPPVRFFDSRQRLFRRLLGDLALIEHGQEAPRRRIRFKCFQCHSLPLAFEMRCRLFAPCSKATDSPRTRSSFRLAPASRTPSSSRCRKPSARPRRRNLP